MTDYLYRQGWNAAHNAWTRWLSQLEEQAQREKDEAFTASLKQMVEDGSMQPDETQEGEGRSLPRREDAT